MLQAQVARMKANNRDHATENRNDASIVPACAFGETEIVLPERGSDSIVSKLWKRESLSLRKAEREAPITMRRVYED